MYSASGTAATFAVQAIDISQDPENSDTVLQMLTFLLESTITSIEVAQAYRIKEINYGNITITTS